jgi:hypothetical protein
MTITRQLELQVLDEMRDDEAGEELVALVRSVVENLGQKIVAARIGWKESRLAHALAERDRHVPARLLAVLSRMDREKRIPRWFADVAGFDVKERDNRSPEEKLAQLVAECRKAGEWGEAALERIGIE